MGNTVMSDTRAGKDPADVTKELPKKDIHCLEKEYYSLKQRLKSQSSAFNSGEKGFPFTSPNLKTVQISKKVESPAVVTAYQVPSPNINTVQVIKKVRSPVGVMAYHQIPMKEVTLKLLHKDYLMGRDSVWHAHLDIHHMLQPDQHCAPRAGTENKKSSYNNLSQFPSRPTSTKKLIYRPFLSDIRGCLEARSL